MANQVEGPPWPEAGGGVAGPVHNLLQERVLARRRQVWRARKLELVERAVRLEQVRHKCQQVQHSELCPSNPGADRPRRRRCPTDV